ncbi:hypothetical protein C0Q70_20219 [Pomacea canaliculata]|uniref:Amine oxidase n=1 Tax=Pomacea canaliculata TaxID=400727 RepID=A0A2T7NEX9_POMCA|nr:hypothetical protein C0Q70_20219 [Pomacea canaliculata]
MLAVVGALVAVVLVKNKEIHARTLMSTPCQRQDGGLLTSGDPKSPSPFHDITTAEYSKLFSYLRSVPELSLADPCRAGVNTSNIFMADLLLPPKRDVLKFLDGSGPQPPREARVLIFRGDKAPPVVEEYRVGPLSDPTYCTLIKNPVRRNPVQFAYRPVGFVEYFTAVECIMKQVDQEVGFILQESYEATFTDCGDKCLTTFLVAVGVSPDEKGCQENLVVGLHPLDFGVLANVDGSDPSLWKVEKVWYAGALYESLTELAARYRDISNPINKIKLPFVSTSRDLFSTQNLRGSPVPATPKRPPLQVEPDGKRYTIKHRHVNYMQWDFDIRLSAFNGPQAYDIRFNGERLVYELGLSEISVYYSGDNPIQRVTDIVDSGILLGIHSKSLIPGADCPEGATFLNASFLSERMAAATELAQATCVFEQNTAMPLRRHLAYSVSQGAFYGGMASSVLVVRSILTILNYDYILDFVFYQNGALEVRAHSTGYILSTFYRPQEAPYGFRLAENINGNIHHHMFHFKADIDILGTSNRYETLDISTETVNLRQAVPDRQYTQTRFSRHLLRSELQALYNYSFDFPKYHLVYKEGQNTKYGVHEHSGKYLTIRTGMSKQLLPKDVDNEATIPWARQQLAVTVRKDNEQFSTSPYALFDSFDPVVNFANFYNDNESIVDQDLVFWLTLGIHHIPHTEDLPVTPTQEKL